MKYAGRLKYNWSVFTYIHQNYNMIFIYSFILNHTTIGSIHTHKTQRQTRTNTNRIEDKFTLEKTK